MSLIRLILVLISIFIIFCNIAAAVPGRMRSAESEDFQAVNKAKDGNLCS